jgi:hypothetical protein
VGPSELSSEVVAARAMVVIYGVFLGLVLAERASHINEAVAELKAALERQKATWRQRQEFHRSRLKMAYEVWEATGQRVDLA